MFDRAKYYKNRYDNEPQFRKNMVIAQTKYKRRLLMIILDHYGWKCACCGETNWYFFTLDHKNNDGKIHRQKIKDHDGAYSVYADVIKNNFPNTYQILCYNCNLGKNRIRATICPHLLLKAKNPCKLCQMEKEDISESLCRECRWRTQKKLRTVYKNQK